MQKQIYILQCYRGTERMGFMRLKNYAIDLEIKTCYKTFI